MHSLRASPVFALAVLITLGLAGLNGLMVGLMALRLNFLLPGPFAQMTHFTEAHHRIHDLTFGFIFVPIVVGMLAQLRRPSKNVAGQLMALIPSVGLVLTLVLTFVLTNNTNVLRSPWTAPAASTLIAAILHPTWRGFFRSFSVSRVNWVLLALVVIAAVPLLAFVSTNIGLQGTVRDDHAELGHYGFMAAFGFTIVGVGLLAGLRPDGWRLPAWVAGFLPALLGLASLAYPDVSSSLGLVWALAAIAWGVGFVAAAELITRATEENTHMAGLSPDTGVGRDRESTPGTPLWVKVFGIIALAVVLLFVILRLFGGGGHGPDRHTPSGDAGGNRSPSASQLTEDAAQVVTVAMKDIAFEPVEIEVERGALVRLAFQNTGVLRHDFTIEHMRVEDMRAQGGLTSGNHADHGRDRAMHLALEPRASSVIEFRATAAGEYEFYCEEPVRDQPWPPDTGRETRGSQTVRRSEGVERNGHHAAVRRLSGDCGVGVVGGTGILALMLLSVKERTGEIGLRVAVGVRPRDILIQSLLETTVLALGGWTGRIVLGAAGATAVALSTTWQVAVPMIPAIQALLAK